MEFCRRFVELQLRQPTASDALLVVEIADSSLDKDLNRKMPVCAAAGIAEAWVMDLNAGKIEVHRDPQGGTYRTHLSFRRGDLIEPLFGGEILVEAWVGKCTTAQRP